MPRLDYICEGFLQEGGGKEGARPRLPVTPAILRSLKMV